MIAAIETKTTEKATIADCSPVRPDLLTPPPETVVDCSPWPDTVDCPGTAGGFTVPDPLDELDEPGFNTEDPGNTVVPPDGNSDPEVVED